MPGNAVSKRRLPDLRSAMWFAAIAMPFILFAIYPLLVMVKASFVPSGTMEPEGFFGRISFFFTNFTLKFYGKIFVSRYLQEFYNTLIFAGLNTFISLLIGTTLAIYLYYRNFPLSRLLSSLLIIPYIVPNYILVISVISVTGNNGLINMVLRSILGNPDFTLPLKVMHTYHGILLVFIFHGIPLAAFIISAVLTSINKSYIEAAIGLGASPLKAIIRVVLPLTVPGIIAAGSIIFAYTMCNYVVVFLMGGTSYANLAVEIFNQYFGYDTFDFASALSVTLSAMTMTIMYVYFVLIRKKA
jgi:ABC-type Fe3+ transport system permease subunit